MRRRTEKASFKVGSDSRKVRDRARRPISRHRSRRPDLDPRPRRAGTRAPELPAEGIAPELGQDARPGGRRADGHKFKSAARTA